MRNGWTGGQYSVYRALFGLYLLIHFLHLLPWAPELFSSRGALPHAADSPLVHLFPNVLGVVDGPGAVRLLLALAAALSVFFTVGWWDRLAAVALWYLWACLIGRNPLIANPGLPYVGWLLLAHAVLPPASYGTLAARGRPDPSGGWRMTPAIYCAAWVLMALGYSYSGAMKLSSPSWIDGSAFRHVLENPLARPSLVRAWLLSLPPAALQCATWGALGLELLFAPLALVRRLRPWIWTAMLVMHLGLFALVDFVDLTVGMVILHMFTFDPAWIPAQQAGGETENLFYDGHCGLCHRAVRFVLAEDRDARALRFAPLQGETFERMVPAERRAELPDSIVVQTREGALLVRSAAFIHILRRLGGGWRALAAILSVVPRALRDAAYDFVARVRYRIFGRPDDVCPIVPPDLRKRFAP